MKQYDVIVIGSGPAGCAVAMKCHHAGLQVLVISGEVDAGSNVHHGPHPVESIHPGVSSLLQKVGLSGVEVSATVSHYSGTYVNDVYSALGSDKDGEWKGMHLDRRVFDANLLRKLLESGIDVVLGNRLIELIVEDKQVIGVNCDSGKYLAKYVIDASGKKAIGGKQLKFSQKFFSQPLVCWTGVSGEMNNSFSFDSSSTYFIPGDRGWTWLAPMGKYCAWTRLSVKGEKEFAPPDELKRYPVVGEIIKSNMRWRMFRPLVTEGLILCGDAGGVLDPSAGQGIFNALSSGMMAGNTVVACLREPDFAGFHLAQYDGWFVEYFEEKVGMLRGYYGENGIGIE